MLTDGADGFFSWGELAVTAPTPKGPWSEPVLVLGVESNRYYPPTAESFPAFVHEGYVYNPATSVALNRNCQVIYRAEIEQAHRPQAWQLYQFGTAWHSEYVPHEGFGIWGQTFSGFSDAQGQFHVLFPSRERSSGVGTINFASRPWNKPLRDRGFVLSGHAGSSFTLLRSAYRGFELETDLTVHGNAARIVWGCRAPSAPTSIPPMPRFIRCVAPGSSNWSFSSNAGGSYPWMTEARCQRPPLDRCLRARRMP